MNVRLYMETFTNLYIIDSLIMLFKTGDASFLGSAIKHLILPSIALGTIPLAIIARTTRSSMLEVLKQDYVKTARAAGIPERKVIYRYALKNALLPIITVIGLQFGLLLSGAILTETIFAWPGVGKWIYHSISARDYPAVQGGNYYHLHGIRAHQSPGGHPLLRGQSQSTTQIGFKGTSVMSDISATDTTNIREIKDPTPFQEALHNLKQNRAAVAGLIIIALFLIVGIFAPLISPHDPFSQIIANRKLPPFSAGYLLGTDDLGRDMLSRLIYGARISMIIGVVSVGIAMSFGILIGVTSGYIGGIYDKLVMRVIDIMLAFPYILLTIVIVAVLGPSLFNAMVAIGISQVPRYARLVRASVLAEKEADYVTAERSLGASPLSLMFISILPNCLAPVSVQATLGVGEAILSSAALSFLGLGAQPPTPEWGLMIASSREFITNAWWIVTFPGLATLFAVLGFNLFGDGLRDILDSRN